MWDAAAGVEGMKRGVPSASRPAFSGVLGLDVLRAAAARRNTRDSGCGRGSGRSTRIAGDLRVTSSSAICCPGAGLADSVTCPAAAHLHPTRRRSAATDSSRVVVDRTVGVQRAAAGCVRLRGARWTTADALRDRFAASATTGSSALAAAPPSRRRRGARARAGRGRRRRRHLVGLLDAAGRWRSGPAAARPRDAAQQQRRRQHVCRHDGRPAGACSRAGRAAAPATSTPLARGVGARRLHARAGRGRARSTGAKPSFAAAIASTPEPQPRSANAPRAGALEHQLQAQPRGGVRAGAERLPGIDHHLDRGRPRAAAPRAGARAAGRRARAGGGTRASARPSRRRARSCDLDQRVAGGRLAGRAAPAARPAPRRPRTRPRRRRPRPPRPRPAPARAARRAPARRARARTRTASRITRRSARRSLPNTPSSVARGCPRSATSASCSSSSRCSPAQLARDRPR